MGPASFGGVSAPENPVQLVAAIEADLAPLVIDYAQQLYAAGEIKDDDLPKDLADNLEHYLYGTPKGQ